MSNIERCTFCGLNAVKPCLHAGTARMCSPVEASARQLSEQPGFVMVPVEPSIVMLEQGRTALHEDSMGDFDATLLEIKATYRAMLEARPLTAFPTAPSTEASEPVRDERADEAPPNSLPTWDECALRVENSDFLAKRKAGGGYGPEHDSKTADDLHRFIYEYDDADPYRSAWFMHRLELAINAARALKGTP